MEITSTEIANQKSLSPLPLQIIASLFVFLTFHKSSMLLFIRELVTYNTLDLSSLCAMAKRMRIAHTMVRRVLIGSIEMLHTTLRLLSLPG
jgi:hypothetical protein